MHPVLTTFEWGGSTLPLASYGLLLAVALLFAGVFGLRACVRAGLDEGAIIAAIGCAVLGGFAGAVLLHAAVGCSEGLPLMAALSRPGLVFYGGALGALFGFGLAGARLGLPVWLALDVATPVLPIAHAIGRVGCLLGGCCFGAEHTGPLAILYTDPLAPAAHPSVPRHPWPLYEVAGLLVLASLLVRLPRDAQPRGQRFLAYVVGYALLRFALEPLRADAVRGTFLALSTSQLVALVTLLAALLFARPRTRCT